MSTVEAKSNTGLMLTSCCSISQTSPHNTYLGPEELHDSNLSIHAHFLNGPKPLCCDHINLQPCVFGYEQIEVFRRGEVTCRHIYITLITVFPFLCVALTVVRVACWVDSNIKNLNKLLVWQYVYIQTYC